MTSCSFVGWAFSYGALKTVSQSIDFYTYSWSPGSEFDQRLKLTVLESISTRSMSLMTRRREASGGINGMKQLQGRRMVCARSYWLRPLNTWKNCLTRTFIDKGQGIGHALLYPSFLNVSESTPQYVRIIICLLEQELQLEKRLALSKLKESGACKEESLKSLKTYSGQPNVIAQRLMMNLLECLPIKQNLTWLQTLIQQMHGCLVKLRELNRSADLDSIAMQAKPVANESQLLFQCDGQTSLHEKKHDTYYYEFAV